ncbi:MAG TPA: hypothetical protein VF653_11230 [Methylomirabilota bacterium]
MNELRGWRRILWVGSLLIALAAITVLLLRYGADRGIGSAP